MLSVYPACFFKEENGYSVIFPDLNGLATCGETIDEAMAMAVDCLAGYLYTCEKDGDNIPAPSMITDIDVAAVAEQISPGDPVGEAFVNMVSVDVAAYAREHFEKSVRKTLTIPAWLNSAALEQGINFSQTLQEALIGKLSSSQTR
jgi:predicted RNase H-like HicB family nuclease